MTLGGPRDREGWARSLRALAQRGLDKHDTTSVLARASRGEPVSEEEALHAARAFRDERGHRRSVDGWIVARVLNTKGFTGPGDARGMADRSADVVLFRGLLLSAELPVEAVSVGEGSLVPFDPEIGIERWTQTELGALHALGVWAARGAASERAPLAARVRAAARWHIAELQPDNATNHAWAVHVFAELAVAGEDGAVMHAQTLMHNAMVAGGGVPDAFSSILLLDAAMVLEGGGWLG